MLNNVSMSLLHNRASYFGISFITLAEKRSTIVCFSCVCAEKLLSSWHDSSGVLGSYSKKSKSKKISESSTRRNKLHKCTVNICNGSVFALAYLLSRQMATAVVTAWSHCLSSPMAVRHTPSHISQPEKEDHTYRLLLSRILLYCSQIPPLHKYIPHIPPQINVIPPPLELTSTHYPTTALHSRCFLVYK